MILKKQYNQPKIDQIEIDVSISLQTESGLPGGDGPPGGWDVNEITTTTKEEDNSGIKENPFER